MRKIIFIFLFAFSTAGYCETTGNELYSQLTSNDSSDTLRGFAYIQGVLDSEDWYLTADIFTNIDPKRSKPEKFKIAHICFGNNGITFGQVKDIVQKHLTDHPETRHYRAQVLIRTALLEHFACANNPEIRSVHQ